MADLDFLFSVTELYDQARVEIQSGADPVTLQSGRSRRAALRSSLAASISDGTRGVFTHDVEVTLVWFIEEARRYQTHMVADLDNVLKLILDAASGPNGILVDGNQVQSIRASWMTPGSLGPGIHVSVEALMVEDFLARSGLTFVEFSPDRCYMLPKAPEDAQRGIVSSYRTSVSAYERLEAAGICPDAAQGVLPIARPFPRARLGKFTVRHQAEFREPPLLGGDFGYGRDGETQ